MANIISQKRVEQQNFGGYFTANNSPEATVHSKEKYQWVNNESDMIMSITYYYHVQLKQDIH